MKNETDVIIVGGGPAGAACAGRLREGGIGVLILDKSPFPRPKTCAGWITPEVFQLLKCDPEEYPFGLTHFDSFVISLRGAQFKPKVNQFAIRRIEFDGWLLQRSGAHVEMHTVKNIQQGARGFEIDGKYRSKYLVGAGGTLCPIQRTIFEKRSPRRANTLIVAMEAEFPYAFTDGRCHLWFFEAGLPGYAWYVPKKNGYVNIGVGGKQAGLRAKKVSITTYWERLVRKITDQGLINGQVSQPKGYTYYLRQARPHIREGNAFIVGDAAGLATRDMGEGIRTAVESGIIAAEAIINQTEYSVAGLPKYSAGSLFMNRK